MWLPRTEQEQAAWLSKAELEAKSSARWNAIIIWVVITVLGGAGWYVSISMGAAIRTHTNLPVALRFLVVGFFTIPICHYLYRNQWRSSLSEKLQRSVCPDCDYFDYGLSGVSCPCGGVNVTASTVKWVDNTSEVQRKPSVDI
jgi:hypothetical protein